jgi:hypothetical protein
MIRRERTEETHVRYDRTCTLWIYNDILNRFMTISDNWIARNMQIRLVKRSSSHNHHFHWMVYVVLWHVVRFSQISHAHVASIQSQDAIGANGISFCYIFNHVCLTFRTYCIVVFHNVCICDHSRFWLSCLRPLVLLLPKLIRVSNISILSVHAEGYSRNASCILNLTSTFLLINYIHKLFFM